MDKTLAKLRNEEPTTIVNLGDSTTIETMLTYGRKTWLSLLHEALWAQYGDGFIWVVNSAQCGGSTAQELERLELSVLRFQPDLVIMGLLLRRDEDGGGFEVDKQRVRELVQRIHDACGSEFIFRTHNPFVIGYWEPRPEDAVPGAAYDVHPDRGSEAAEALVNLAGELGVPICDHYSLWRSHEKPFAHPGANPQGLCMRMADTVHPGPTGHLAYFRDIAPFFGVSPYFPWEEAQ